MHAGGCLPEPQPQRRYRREVRRRRSGVASVLRMAVEPSSLWSELMNKYSVLIAEHDSALRHLLAANLAADGYDVLVADDHSKALAVLTVKDPDLLVLDMNGATLALVDAVRSAVGLVGAFDPDIPLLVLSDQRDLLHRVRLLERGGDDVMSKPFEYLELRARVAALLRRSELRSAPQVRRVGPISIDLRTRQVLVGDEEVALSPKEYELLVVLARDPGRVFRREDLLGEVWGFTSSSRTRTLDSHASRLRRKLAQAGAECRIVNVWGVGYRLNETRLV